MCGGVLGWTLPRTHRQILRYTKKKEYVFVYV